MECHALLFPAISTTWSIFSLPITSFIPTTHFTLCLPCVLLPSIIPKRQSLSTPTPLTTCPTCPSNLPLTTAINSLVVSANCNT
ncbi:hypothetical protein E2C01_040996 [Portunus trituberculatus]|uniref:Uncharacterized protein n=1 Tax=Portunus trituberculatus TaxID=210409 RepID=A0A5B7FP40_PORTR|nr:hypothetical protein [Portunus trituberculatus]